MGAQTRRQSGALRAPASWRDYRFLRYAALIYAAGLVLHTADHVRRGLDVLTPQVHTAGYVSTAAGLFAITLVLARHRWAPLVAIATGFSIALGVVAVHLLPHWGAFSDSFIGRQATGVTALSWGVVLVEIAGAFALGLAGASLLRRRDRSI